MAIKFIDPIGDKFIFEADDPSDEENYDAILDAIALVNGKIVNEFEEEMEHPIAMPAYTAEDGRYVGTLTMEWSDDIEVCELDN